MRTNLNESINQMLKNMGLEIITEARMSRQTIREVVRDITKILKRSEEGSFQLPENPDEDFYSFDNYPIEFSVELEIVFNTDTLRFMTNGAYNLDDDLIQVKIVVNPNKLENQLYDIIGELNNLIAHELEHGLQQYYDEFNLKKKVSKKPLKYYTSPEELGAEVQGFRRVAKLRQIPFDEVVKDWFENNREITNLKLKDEEKVIKTIIDYNREKYG
jgi:hypothetical protein